MATIDDFHPGQHVMLSKTFTEDDVRRFIEITGDVNPLHVDDDFARCTRFGRRVLHGMLTASIFSTMVGMLLHQAVPGFRAWFGVEPNVDDELRQFMVADLPMR